MRTKSLITSGLLIIGLTRLGIAASGVGTATVVSTSVVSGAVETSTITWTVPAGGMQSGGRVEVTAPQNWYPFPQTGNPNMDGFVTVTSTAGSFNAVAFSTMPTVSAVLGGSSIPAGTQIVFVFNKMHVGCPLPNQTVVTWNVKSATDGSTFPTDIAAQPYQTLTSGSAAFLSFIPWNPLFVIAGQPAGPTLIQAQDFCGTPVNVVSAISINLSGMYYNGTSQSDTSAVFSSTPSLTPPSSVVVLSTGTNQVSFYYKTSQLGSNIWINADFLSPLYGTTQTISRSVNSLASLPSFNNVSIDNGVATSGQTTAAMTPDGDGTNDVVYIRFTPSDTTQTWHVTASTAVGAPPVLDRWGTGDMQNGLTWDGRDMMQNNVVPNGTYVIKIEYPGLVQNTSLSATVTSAQISGRVTMGGGGVPFANINAQGTAAGGYAFTQTDNAGNYVLRGLRSGSVYSIYVNFVSSTTQTNMYDSLTNVTAPATNQNFAFAIPARIRIAATLTAPTPTMIFGNVNAHTTNYSKFYNGSIRFNAGLTTSDNGDPFQPSTWSVLNVAPGTYVVETMIPGFSVSSQTVTVGSGATQDIVVPLLAKATVYGKITIPNPATNYEWVPVEVIPSGSSQPQYWSGASIPPGQSSGIYSVFGIDPGAYTFRARPQGYIPATVSTTVASAAVVGDPVNGGLDFLSGAFSTGGQLSGTLTITGDSTSSGGTVYLNLSSQLLGLYFNQAVPFTTNPTSASAPFSFSGLSDGTYQVFPYLFGFETVPPGPKTVTISGGTGTLSLTMAKVSGVVGGAVTLFGSNVDYNQVHINLSGTDFRDLDLTGGPNYSIPNLPSGYYSMIATYRTTGAQVRQSLYVTNGQTTTMNLDLSAPTYSVSGTVSILSGFTMRNSTGTLVTIGTLADLQQNAVSQTVTIGGNPSGGSANACSGGTPTNLSTVRVEAFPKQLNGYNDPTRNGFSNCFAIGQYSYGLINASGQYTISGLTPGVWEISVYPYFDGGTAPNVAVTKQVVTITSANQTVDFGLTSGNSVSGTVSFPSGVTDIRSYDVQILTQRGTQVQTATLDIGSGLTAASSANFIFPSLAAGDYSIVLRERTTWDSVLGFVTKYVAKPVAFTISGSDVTGLSIVLSRAARIVGKLAVQAKDANGQPTVTLINNLNNSLLSSSFGISAQSFPWVEGGFGFSSMDSSNHVSFDSNNQWRIDGLIAGTYDLSFRDNGVGTASGSGSGGTLNLAALTKAQILVAEGQILDVGTITMAPGLSVSGTVKDAAGNGLPNIRVRAHISLKNDHQGLETITDSQGQFTLTGLNPTDKIYDFEAAPRPGFSDPTPAVPYQTARKFAVDVTAVPAPTLNFTLVSANSAVTGKVVTVDGGPLDFPESENAGYPAAALYLKQQGVQGNSDDPLGDIRAATALDGTFTVNYLAPGTYILTIDSLGYRPVRQTISVTNGTLAMGTITLQKGASLTATLAKPNGSAVTTSDVRTAVAVTSDLSSIIFGKAESDANTKNITSVKWAGFETNKTYSVLLFDELDNIVQPPEGRSLSFASVSDALTLALTYQPSAPTAITAVRKSGSDIVIDYYFTRPLRNTQTFDADPTQFVTLTTGSGVLSGHSVASDRRSMTLLYTPAVGEQTCTMAFLAYSTDIDPATNTEFAITKTSTLLFGQKAFAEGNINPALGGDVTLASNNDPSGITLPSNALLTSAGVPAASSGTYNISFSATDDLSTVGSASLGRAAVFASVAQRGPSAYLPEAWSAIQSARASSSINPLSSFYSVLLPSGLSHTLNQSATLTLSYSSSVDPSTINVYYYDGTRYILERTNRTVDTANHTISVSVSHFSTFVILSNSAAVVTVNGGSASGSPMEVMNFPNPFDLTTKTKTLTHGGTTSTMDTDGTIIRYVIPAAQLGATKIVIYNVVGEKVRTIDLGAPTADTYNYVAWDGKNDSGNKVASGVYIGELKSGSAKAFFKMAVIK